MKIYIDFNNFQITKKDSDVIFQGDVLSNAFELLFYNYSDTSWFPTMSQLAPNGRQAGDFAADPLEPGESQTETIDGVTYLKYKFTIGAGWCLVKGKSNFFIWKNTATTPMTRKCIGRVMVTLNESTETYFIDDVEFNPNVKAYIDAEIDAIEARLGDGSPKYFDTAANIALLTEDKGLAVATDTGHLYYWDSTSTSTTKYTDSGLVYNDLSAYYTKTQSDTTFASKSTAITHTGNQLQDYSGNNIIPYTIVGDLGLQTGIAYNHLESAGTNTNASIRWFANEPILKNTYINSVDIYVGATAYATGTITVEIWEVSATDTLTRVFNTSKTNNNITGNINIPINYKTTRTAYVSVYRVGTFIPQIVYNASETNGVLFISDIASTTLTMSSFSSYSGHLSLRVNYTIQKDIQKLANTLYVGEKGDFANIQDAINSINDDASNNPYTIIVDKGTYARFSMRSSVTGISRMRYISIIGIDKENCLIYDDTGHYVTGSCDVWSSGVIENLTIKVDHTNDISEANRKAYALHMDFGQCNLIVRNCILKSNNGPAVGIGLYQDTTITFEDCDIYSDCPSDYTALLNYGALFCHGNTSSGITNQNLNVYNCRIVSINGDRGAWYSNPGHNSVTITSINTLYYTGAVGGSEVVLDDVTVSDYSYGNTASALNKDGVFGNTVFHNGNQLKSASGTDLYPNIDETKINLLDGEVDGIFVVSKNILDMDNITIVEGKYLNITNGNESTNASYFYTNEYIPVEPSTTYYVNSWKKSDDTQLSMVILGCLYDEHKTYISGFNGGTFTTPSNCYFLRFSTVIDAYNYRHISISKTVLTSFVPYYKIIKNSLTEEKITIKCASSGTADFRNLRKCLESITDASKDRQYVVELAEGTYDFTNDITNDELADNTFKGIFVPDFVTIKGIGNAENTIIQLTLATQNNNISTLNMRNTAGLENLTVKGTNTRYVIHDDFTDNSAEVYYRTLKNVRIIGTTCSLSTCYGCGAHSGMIAKFENCVFDGTNVLTLGGNGIPVLIHNNVEWTHSVHFTFDNCRMLTSGSLPDNVGSSRGGLLLRTLQHAYNNSSKLANMFVYVTIKGCELNDIVFREENATYYGTGCMFKVNGYGNKTDDYRIYVTDSVDYSSYVNLI